MGRRWDENGNLIPEDGRSEPQRRRWDENGRLIIDGSATSPRATVGQEVEGALAAINRGIPFSNDVSSAGAGVLEAARGGNFGEGFRRQRQRTIDAANAFTARHPLGGNFLTGAGMALPVAMTMGALSPLTTMAQRAGMVGAERAAMEAATRQSLAARAPTGAAGFLNQTAQASAGGAGGALVYGAGAPEQAGQSLRDRYEAGRELMPLGAAAGAATPAIVNTAGAVLRPAWRAFASPEPIATRAAEQGAGVFGSQAFSGGGRRPPRRPRSARIPREAAGTLDRLRQRSVQSVDQLEARVAQAQADPQGRVVADLFDDPGVRTLRAIGQGPGQTGQRMARVVRERIAAAPGRIAQALERGLGVGESRHAALTRLEGSYRDLSSQAYGPLWRRPMTVEQRQLYQQRIAPMLDPDNPNAEVRRIMQIALRKARAQFDLDLQVGRVEGTFDENLPRALHYIKQELGNRADFERVNLRGTSGNRIGTLRQLYRQFADMLDPPQGSPIQGGAIIPDYRRISSAAGDYFSAREALEEGAAWLRMSADEVRASRTGMTDFELYHARVALADEIRSATRGRVVGNQNVAAKLDDPEMQQAIAVAFDTPEQAARFLSTVNTQNELARNALGWGGGSTTYTNALHGADEALNAMAEGLTAAGGGPGALVRPAWNMAQRAATLGAIERRNNTVGQVLLHPADGPDARAFTDEVIRILRERELSRNAATRIAPRAGAAAGGTTANQRRRQ